jgi:serine/threonine protein kinase
MSLTRIVHIVEPIVSTLETAHACGITHRDLKPANIFLQEGGSVRLLDFGLARLKNAVPLTAAGAVVGSPSFMAPEAWSGLSDFMDERADVYSLGVILFLMMTGQLPFSGASLQDKYLNATTGCRASLLQLRPDLPRGIEEWASLALARDREQRFQNVTALWSAFLATFDLQRRAAGRNQGSLWAAATGAFRKLVGAPRTAAAPVPAPAFRAGLSDQNDLERVRPRLRPPRSPFRSVENTLSMSDSDLISATPSV